MFYPRGCAAQLRGITPIATLERFVVYHSSELIISGRAPQRARGIAHAVTHGDHGSGEFTRVADLPTRYHGAGHAIFRPQWILVPKGNVSIRGRLFDAVCASVHSGREANAAETRPHRLLESTSERLLHTGLYTSFLKPARNATGRRSPLPNL